MSHIIFSGMFYLSTLWQPTPGHYQNISFNLVAMFRMQALCSGVINQCRVTFYARPFYCICTLNSSWRNRFFTGNAVYTDSVSYFMSVGKPCGSFQEQKSKNPISFCKCIFTWRLLISKLIINAQQCIENEMIIEQDSLFALFQVSTV